MSESDKKKDGRERAVALQYRDLNELPKIAAAGVGQLAREIIALAQAHHVPVQKDQALAEMLAGSVVAQQG